MKDLRLKYKIWIETDDQDGVLGDGKWKLLKTIHECGSLKEAMKIHEFTYRKTWDNLNKMENILGFQVIERTRGGKDGGNTVLTPRGKAIVDAFDAFHEEYDSIINKGLNEVLEKIKTSL